jgi:hypothetical protein
MLFALLIITHAGSFPTASAGRTLEKPSSAAGLLPARIPCHGGQGSHSDMGEASIPEPKPSL